jgi:RNA polymerase sigma-70 factor (ECF subfamily)
MSSKNEKLKELDLLKRAQHNDQKAFIEIFNRNRFNVFYIVYNIVNDITTAEDLTMITFEKAFTNIKNFVPNYKLSTWIFKIARNLAIDYIRFQSIRARLVELDDTMPYNSNPEDELIAKEREKIFDFIIENLNEKYKKILFMRIEENKKCKEIANKLNIPINTVTGTIRRCRQKILIEQEKLDRIKISK